MNPGGGSGWDEPPLDIQIPDDARELDRDVLAYHRELRAKRRRNRLRRLAGPLAGRGTVMPLLASILAVCLVAGAMLSVATFSPATAPGGPTHPPAGRDRDRRAQRRRGRPPDQPRPPPTRPTGHRHRRRQRSGHQRVRAPARAGPLGEPVSLLEPGRTRPAASRPARLRSPQP